MSENVTRRTVLRGAGAAGAVAAAAASAAACGSSTASTTAPAGGTSSAATTSSPGATTPAGTGTSSGTSSAPAASGTTVAKADVPVGGGRIVGSAVVTQPASGTFKAFSSTCTHQGCTVSEVSDNEILCRCHNSSFDAGTGAVLGGPARSALPAKTVTDSGTSVVVA